MNKNNYNFNESEFEEIKKLLKELPKEKAADNFEYNLMVRIRNGNFEQITSVKESFSLWKYFAPTAGLAATAVAIFFFISNVNEELPENPFQIQPQLRTEISENLKSSLPLQKIFGKHKITDNDVVIIEPKKNETKRIVVNDKIPKHKTPKHQGIAGLPFKISNSTNLDVAIHRRKERTNRNLNGRAALAGMGSAQSRFDGFYIGEEVDKKEVEAMKARIDSIKKYFLMHQR